RGEDEDRREGPQLPDPAAATPEEGASSRELARQLEAAVEELPPKQRAALLLSRVDGLAYRDVAEALGCTEGAVKALLFRATQPLEALAPGARVRPGDGCGPGPRDRHRAADGPDAGHAPAPGAPGGPGPAAADARAEPDGEGPSARRAACQAGRGAGSLHGPP